MAHTQATYALPNVPDAFNTICLVAWDAGIFVCPVKGSATSINVVYPTEMQTEAPKIIGDAIRALTTPAVDPQQPPAGPPANPPA